VSGREQSQSSGERSPSGGGFQLSGLKPEQVEAIRLADALSATDAGERPSLDPVEDPELSGLVRTAGDLRVALETATTRASFEAFHRRSRLRVVAATPSPRPAQMALQQPRGSILDRWAGLFTSIAAAAAASIATFVVTVAAMGGGPGSPAAVSTEVSDSPETVAASDTATAEAAPPVTNLTALSTSQVMAQWRFTLARITTLTNEGRPVDVALIDEVIGASSSFAARAQRDPDSVTGTDAYVAWHAGFASQQVLSKATVTEPEGQQALDTAQLTSDGAMVVAARFLDENPDRRPSAAEAAVALGLAEPPDEGATDEGAADDGAATDEGEPASDETDSTVQAEPQP
jgi:hypothetical protein